MDDHFQGIFLGGAVKLAVATGTITAASGAVLGFGNADVYTISSTSDNPPIITASAETVYNPSSVNTFTTGDTFYVVDTGRFFVAVTQPKQGYTALPARAVVSLTNTHTITPAELLSGYFHCTPGSGTGNYTLPTATDLVNAIPGVFVGMELQYILLNFNGNTSQLVTNTGVTLRGRTSQSISGEAHTYRVLITAISGTPTYTNYGMQ